MITRRQWRRFFDKPMVEWGMLAAGILLIIAGIIIAPLPGPGGIFLIAPGLALVLKSSMWAKRRYARFKRSRLTIRGRPVGHLADLALRRRSALRRERLRKDRKRGQAMPGD